MAVDNLKNVIITIVLIVVVAISTFAIIQLIPSNNEITHAAKFPQEQLQITSTHLNGTTLYLDCQSLNANINLNSIIIKNATNGATIDQKAINNTILKGEMNTILTDISTLSNGTYVATVKSTHDCFFESENFTIGSEFRIP